MKILLKYSNKNFSDSVTLQHCDYWQGSSMKIVFECFSKHANQNLSYSCYAYQNEANKMNCFTQQAEVKCA